MIKTSHVDSTCWQDRAACRSFDRSEFDLQDGSLTQLVALINKARVPTTQRVSALQAEVDSLRKQLAEAQRKRHVKAGQAEDEEEEDEGTPKPQEVEEVIKNPIHDYITMLEGMVRLHQF